MKKVFLDTNIIIDLIADRKPFSKNAIEIFQKAEQNQFQLFVSSHSIATTHYILKKHLGENELRNLLIDLLHFLNVIAVDNEIINKSLKSNHSDFEDAIQIYCASSIRNMDCIVTRNVKDFKNSEIQVLNPDELLFVL